MGAQMSDETVTRVDKFTAPFGQEIELLDVRLEGDVHLMRVRIREGARFTVFDLDPVTARRWGQALDQWATATGTLD